MSKAWFGLAVVALLTVIGFLTVKWLDGRPHGESVTQPEDSIKTSIRFAVEQAGLVCLSDLTEEQQNEIKLDLSSGLEKLSTGGRLDSKKSRESVGKALSNENQLKDRQGVRECMAQQVPLILDREEKERERKSAGGNLPALAPELVSDPALSAGAIGYIYYEENQGRPTADGVFRPKDAAKLPVYADVREGTLLKSVAGARLRQEPDGLSPIVRVLDGGQCVRVIGPPADPMMNLTMATSGGRLRVQAISC